MYSKRLRVLFIALSIVLLILLHFSFSYKRIYFSHSSGFYEEQFYLELKTDKNSKVFYTLDGTKPTPRSIPYTKPILIKDATQNPNVLSNIKELTFDSLYERKVVDIPKYPVDKATILRVAKYDKRNNLLSEDYRIFFVNFEKKVGYDFLPIVSVLMEPEDIFDEKKGIFVVGKKENRKIKSCYEKGDNIVNFCEGGGNWIRKAKIDIFDYKHEENILSQNVLIKIKGAESRQWPQKSMSLYADKNYDGSNYFKHNPFRNNVKLHNFALFNGGDDVYIKLREYLIQSTEEELNPHFITIRMIPCVVFLNGEYWGVYYMAENCTRQFLSDLFNIKKSNIIIKKDLLEANQYSKDLSALFGYYDKLFGIKKETPLYNIFQDNDLSDKNNYEKVCKIIDIESFINYFATQIYIANSDWPEHNWALWRTANKDKGCKYSDSKWRYILFDVNDLCALENYKYDSFEKAIKYSSIFNSLIRNKEFREKLRQRIYYLETQVYTPEKMNKLIDEWLYFMRIPINKSNDRFAYGNSIISFDWKVNEIRTFFIKRPQYINKYIDKHFAKFEKDGM